MNWTFSVKNKVKASFTLLLLCGIVFFSNYRLKHLSSKVAASVRTIYEDRLVVQDIIYSYSKILSQLENAGQNGPTHQIQTNLSTQLDDLNGNYSRTVFTQEEALLFESFSMKLSEIVRHKDSRSDEVLVQMKSDLNRLEQIQMEEAKKQMMIIEEARGSQEVSFYVETAILVILLVIVQALVVSNTTVQRVVRDDQFSQN